MRKGRDNCWITNNKGEFCGINLGADFVAEHEWGIKGLKQLFNMPTEEEAEKAGKLGIERRRLPKPAKECVILFEAGDTLVMLVDSAWGLKDAAAYIKKDDPKTVFAYSPWWNMGPKEEMVTAWSEGDLGIRVRGDENKAKLQSLYNALVSGEVAVWLGGGGFLMNAGLCLAIIDKVDDEKKAVMAKADKSNADLKVAAQKTGIKDKIDKKNEFWKQCQEVENGQRCYDKAPHAYMALSPAWSLSLAGSKTKYNVVFWLNPYHQQEVNYGWYTVEELEQWLEGKGPIPMTAKQKQKEKAKY